MLRHLFTLLATLLFFSNLCPVAGQSYLALHGSNYNTSLTHYNNPSSILNTDDRWNLNLFAFQYQFQTNSLERTTPMYSPVKSDSKYRFVDGKFEREAFVKLDIHLLNARYALNSLSAISVGFNLKGYGNVNTSRFNYPPGTSGISSFVNANATLNNLDAALVSSSWMELTGTYSRILYETDYQRFNAGITLKINRGLSGAILNLNNFAITGSSNTGMNETYLRDGHLNYAYSSNYDNLPQKNPAWKDITEFVKGGRGSIGMDLGAEFLIKLPGGPGYYDSKNRHDYSWKFGMAVLDVGRNQYAFSRFSRDAGGIRENVDADLLELKFNRVIDIAAFSDSLRSVVTTVNPLNGKFRINNPTRLVLNVDHSLGYNLYLNADLSMNLSEAFGSLSSVIESNGLTITPRWETKRFGAFLPIQYHRFNQLWVGAALKLGPVVIGLHNISGDFIKNPGHNEGGFIALVLNPSNRVRKVRNAQTDCPVF